MQYLKNEMALIFQKNLPLLNVCQRCVTGFDLKDWKSVVNAQIITLHTTLLESFSICSNGPKDFRSNLKLAWKEDGSFLTRGYRPHFGNSCLNR